MSLKRVGPSAVPSYSGAVPAVMRALDVLECIGAEPAGLNLSRISREVGASPSSVLAVLRTLVTREYLTYDPAAGRYRMGPALAELAGGDLSTLTVWRSAEAVVALARAATADPSGSEDARSAALAALGTVTRELAALLVGEADRSSPSVTPPTVWQTGASGPLGAEELKQFLEGDLLATLACVKDDGYPYSVPVWYHWERERFWLIPRGQAGWARYVTLNPRVSLAISEHQPPLRRVLIEGVAGVLPEEESTQMADRLISLMAPRYLGTRATAYLEATLGHRRQVFSVAPAKLVTWRGLAAHPRYGQAGELAAERRPS